MFSLDLIASSSSIQFLCPQHIHKKAYVLSTFILILLLIIHCIGIQEVICFPSCFEIKNLLSSISPQGHSKSVLRDVLPLLSCESSTKTSSHYCHLLTLHTNLKKQFSFFMSEQPILLHHQQIPGHHDMKIFFAVSLFTQSAP